MHFFEGLFMTFLPFLILDRIHTNALRHVFFVLCCLALTTMLVLSLQTSLHGNHSADRKLLYELKVKRVLRVCVFSQSHCLQLTQNK